MCDDKSGPPQVLFEKLSRQLSELNSADSNPINQLLTPGVGGQWATSSGLPEGNNRPSTFSPLPPWDPTFPLAAAAPNSLNPGFLPSDATSLGPTVGPLPGPHLSGKPNNWSNNPLPSNYDFQVVGDLSGRFSNVSLPPSQLHSQLGYDHQLNGSHQRQSQSNSQILGQNFSSSHQADLFSSLSSAIRNNSSPPQNHLQNLSHQDSTPSFHEKLSAGNRNFATTNSSTAAESFSFDHKLPFDPSTPPPQLPFDIQPPRSFDRPASADISQESTEYFDCLGLNGNSTFNQNLGAIGGDSSWGLFKPVENQDVFSSDEGKELYAEALNKWSSFDFTGIDSASIGSSSTDENLTSNETIVSESQDDSVNKDIGKPSYSEIAKTPKFAAKPSSVSKSSFLKKDGKPYKPLIQRAISASKVWPKGTLSGEVDLPKVSPTSRYGLDNFEDTAKPSENLEKHAGVSNSSRNKRRGSCADVFDHSLHMTDKINLQEKKKQATNDSLNVMEKLHFKTMTSDKDKSTAAISSNKKPVSDPSSSKSDEKVFFDPKRIFQTKYTNSCNDKSKTQPTNTKSAVKPSVNEKPSVGDTILNNGKPAPSSPSFKLPTVARKHDYINNDLRDTNKETNKAAAESGHSFVYERSEVSRLNKLKESKPVPVKRASTSKASGNREKRKATEEVLSKAVSSGENWTTRFLPKQEQCVEWLTKATEKLSVWGSLFFLNALNLILCTVSLVWRVTYSLLCISTSFVVFLGLKVWIALRAKIRLWRGSESRRDYSPRKLGLDENIALPTTGQEAMKRLLAGKGKDPYSILGLRQDCSDEDIKRYYKKQAVLVHPDKNQEPGAEEAFKILNHAFERIGEASKRKEYHNQVLNESESALRKEFTDLISQLQTKIQEAANLMPCDKCEKKHRRFPVLDRTIHYARYCEEHQIKHPAKEGDVWAESTMLGFYWHYYAVMEGKVFEITEWMKCHEQYYKHMKANDHSVRTKIATDSKKNKAKTYYLIREPKVEDFLNHILNKTTAGFASGATGGSQPQSGPDPGFRQTWGQTSSSTPSSTAPAGASSKKGGARRKKKRH